VVVTQQDIDNFHEFASAQLANSEGELTLANIIAKWQSYLEREDSNSAIRESLADIAAGRIIPATEAIEQLRHKFDSADR
jgi:predicted transcriptional regulator